MGNYVPYSIRATLHDCPMTPEFKAWRQQAQQEAAQRQKDGIVMENPNTIQILVPISDGTSTTADLIYHLKSLIGKLHLGENQPI